MNRSVIFILIALASGCSTPNAADKKLFIESMNKWVGRTADDLVAENGAPTSVYLLQSGGREFEYDRVLQLGQSETDALQDYMTHCNKTKLLYVPDTRTPSSTNASGLSNNVLASGVTYKLLFDVTAGNIVESWKVDDGSCN